MSKLCERSNPLGVRLEGGPRLQTTLPSDTNRPTTLIEDRPWLSFSSLTILCGMAVNRLFLTESHSNPTKSPIRGGNSVSWLLRISRSLRLVKLPISGGSFVSWLSPRISSMRLVKLPISRGSSVRFTSFDHGLGRPLPAVDAPFPDAHCAVFAVDSDEQPAIPEDGFDPFNLGPFHPEITPSS